MTLYQELLDEAMLGIVRKVLLKVQFDGIEDDQSFYISFSTVHPGVVISKRVKAKYPDEITIVLQYQFRNLLVFEDKFTVNITFGGVPETIAVPFEAITAFVDPNANFNLQFRHDHVYEEFDEFDIDDLNREFEALFEKEFKKSQLLDKKSFNTGKVIVLEQERQKKYPLDGNNLKNSKLSDSKINKGPRSGFSTKKISVDDLEENNLGNTKWGKREKSNSAVGKNSSAALSKSQRTAGEVISIDKFRGKNCDT